MEGKSEKDKNYNQKIEKFFERIKAVTGDVLLSYDDYLEIFAIGYEIWKRKRIIREERKKDDTAHV